MMAKKYVVNLRPQEQADLHTLIKKGKRTARVITRARILLLASDDKTDSYIADALQTGIRTVERTRKKFLEGGMEEALSDRPNSGRPKQKLEGKQEAFLIATACSDPPTGRATWTMQLLAERLIALNIVDSISDETVRRTLKKTKSSLG